MTKQIRNVREEKKAQVEDEECGKINYRGGEETKRGGGGKGLGGDRGGHKERRRHEEKDLRNWKKKTLTEEVKGRFFFNGLYEPLNYLKTCTSPPSVKWLWWPLTSVVEPSNNSFKLFSLNETLVFAPPFVRSHVFYFVSCFIQTDRKHVSAPEITSEIPAAVHILCLFLPRCLCLKLCPFLMIIRLFICRSLRVSPFNWTPLLLRLRPHGKVCRHILIWLWLTNQTMLCCIPAPTNRPSEETAEQVTRAATVEGLIPSFWSHRFPSAADDGYFTLLKNTFSNFASPLFSCVWCLFLFRLMLVVTFALMNRRISLPPLFPFLTVEIEHRHPLQAVKCHHRLIFVFLKLSASLLCSFCGYRCSHILVEKVVCFVQTIDFKL